MSEIKIHRIYNTEEDIYFDETDDTYWVPALVENNGMIEQANVVGNLEQIKQIIRFLNKSMDPYVTDASWLIEDN